MAMEFTPSVKPQHERKEFILAKVAESKETVTSFDVYEGTQTPLPVVRLPIELPIYRMANGRTQTKQLAYIAEKGLNPDFFLSQEENEPVQKIQHGFLRNFAHEGTDSIKPIADELERTKQTEALLITQAGVVVNGNRRLAAMRELYFGERGAEFPTFATVTCAVLPVLTSDQVEDIEIRLQMMPEFKLPYGWIDECLKIKKLLASRGEPETIRVMRKKKSDISRAISALNYAEMYLRGWKKKPNDYRLVEAGEQFFNDLVTRLRNKDGSLLEANMRMAWILFDNRLTLGSRIYEFNKVLGEKAAEVLDVLADRLDIEPNPGAPATPPGATAEDIEVDLGEEEVSATSYDKLIEVLEQENRRDETTDALRAACQTILDAKRTAQEGNSAIIAVREANTRLAEVDFTKADPKSYDGIDKQLDEVVRRATELKEKLKSYREGGGEPKTSDNEP